MGVGQLETILICAVIIMMIRQTNGLLFALLSLLLVSQTQGQTAYPMLMSIEPAACQLGSHSEHTLKSRYGMQGAFDVLVSGTGVRGEVVPVAEDAKADSKSKSGETLVVRFHVDANADPGIRDVRIATPHGASTVGQIVLVADPVVYEKKDNDTAAIAQELDLPITACGRIEKAEDVDFFRFHVEAKKTLCFHVTCMRLQDRVHDLQLHADPILTIRDANGSIVASADNELYADPLICHTFDREGDYWLEIRDVRYQGNAYWEYSIEINEQPFVLTSFPVGVAANKKASLELIGYGIGANSHVDIETGPSNRDGIQTILTRVSATQSRKMPMVVSEQPLVDEANTQNDSLAESQSIALPCGINGRIGTVGDVDCFSFDAKKGERYSFEVFARRVGSSLDSQLRIIDLKGNQLQLSDDMRLGKRNYADSWIENWTAPADGKTILEIRDLHLRGGPSYVYFVQITRSEPFFSLFVDTDKTAVSPGTTGVVFVRAEKKNGFDREIQLVVTGLPPGVKAHCGRILAGKGVDGCIVFEADGNANPVAQNIVISGTSIESAASSDSSQRTAIATVYQETYQPGGGRGHWPVESHVVSVTAPSDLRKVVVSTTEITLKPGESSTIDIEIDRAEGFDKNVTLEVTYTHLNTIFGSSLPEGVSVDTKASNTLLTNGATKGTIVLKVEPKALPVEKQQIVVMANVSLNFVMKATYASKPILISIESGSSQRP